MKLENSLFDIIINIICIIQLVGMTIYLIVVWGSLPEQIPGHFDVSGAVTRYDGKWVLLISPIVAFVLFAGICVLERFPSVWNTGVRVTEENQFRIYRILKSLLAVSKLIVVTAFTFITIFQTLAVSLPVWFTPLFLTLTFVAIAFFIVRLVRAR